MHITRYTQLACAASLFFLATTARAQDAVAATNTAEPTPQQSAPPRVAGRLGLGLDLSVLAYESVKRHYDSGGSVTLGLTIVGPGQLAGLGAVLSYGMSEDLLFTTRVALSRTSQNLGSGETTDLRFVALPSLEFLFAHGRTLRPFVGGSLGLLLGNTSTDSSSTTELRGALGASMGIHAFVDEHVSLDPAVRLMLEAGAGSADLGFGLSESVTSFGGGVLATIGLTYWK